MSSDKVTRRALVTGGSGEIGAAICRQLAAQGHHVIVHANRNLAAADEVVEMIRQNGGSAESVQCDLTDASACAELATRLSEPEAVQIIVHNAGIHSDAPLAGMTPEQWHSVIDVSLNGFYNLVQPLLLPMIRTRWGRIVAVSSIAGVTGNRGQANYAAAKAGLQGACKSLAQELASRKITVNAVAPGIIETAMSEQSFPADKIKQMVPMQRAGSPEEVASVVEFLTSEAASYVTSQVISVNGGMI